MTRCRRCNKTLTEAKSETAGIGPVCRRRGHWWLFDVNPAAIPSIAEVEKFASTAARRFLEHAFENETLKEFAEQAASDLKVPYVKQLVIENVKKMQRAER